MTFIKEGLGSEFYKNKTKSLQIWPQRQTKRHRQKEKRDKRKSQKKEKRRKKKKEKKKKKKF